MLTAMYTTRRTTNRAGRNLVSRLAGSPCPPGKSTPLLLRNSATMRLLANSENVDSLPECDGIRQRSFLGAMRARRGRPNDFVLVGVGGIYRRRVRGRAGHDVDGNGGRITRAIGACAGFE